MLPTKKQKEYTLSILAGLIVNIILNVILITTNGAYGAAIATTISQAIVVLVQVYYVKKQLNVRLAFKTAKKYLIGAVVMFIACCFVRMDGILSVIIKMLVGGITYLLMLIILKDKYVYEVRDMLLKRLKK